MKKILIVKTGGTYADYAAGRGDFEDWTALGLSLPDGGWTCIDVRDGAVLPDPAGLAGAVITGSHDMVTDPLPWITDTKAWTRRAVDAGLPLLGICFGHQLMADALGGRAAYHPSGLEIGTADITRTAGSDQDPLFGGLPEVFPGHVTHSQTALKLPEGATLLATGTHDPHQAFRVGRSAWGVQFHPEFDAPAILEYIARREDELAKQTRGAAAIRATVRDTPESASLLKRFADYCLSR